MFLHQLFTLLTQSRSLPKHYKRSSLIFVCAPLLVMEEFGCWVTEHLHYRMRREHCDTGANVEKGTRTLTGLRHLLRFSQSPGAVDLIRVRHWDLNGESAADQTRCTGMNGLDALPFVQSPFVGKMISPSVSLPLTFVLLCIDWK